MRKASIFRFRKLKLSYKEIFHYALFLCTFIGISFAFHTKSKDSPKQFYAIASRYENDLFEHSPELGIFWGRPNVAQDRFTDHSILATVHWQQKEDHYLKEINQLDESALKNSDLYQTYRQLKETLSNNIGARICKEILWNINPSFDGWIAITTQVAENQPIGTPKNRTLALKRWQSFGLFVDVEINNLKEGLNQGYTAPKDAVIAVIKQAKIIINTKTEQSPYFDFARRDDNEVFKKQVTQLISTVINPALQRYVTFLEKDYLPQARKEIGVSALPNGYACYLAKVKKETTLDITPKEIYNFGLSHMASLNKEVATIGQKTFGLTNMTQVFERAQYHTDYLFTSKDAILKYNHLAYERAKSKLPEWFGIDPSQAVMIKPYPEFRAKTGASGEYYPPNQDGSRPGIFYINTYAPKTHSRVNQEAILFHELIPGHHLQLLVANQKIMHHSLDKYFLNSGFGEGWALYAERLADEMGLYSDDISRIGMLSNEALRTARLVVDPGIHVMHWTRSQAITYLKKHSTFNDRIIEGEVDRYIMNPAQATAYMLGKREIDKLRHQVEANKNEKFDIIEFHDQLLKYGMVTLPILKDNIQWHRQLI